MLSRASASSCFRRATGLLCAGLVLTLSSSGVATPLSTQYQQKHAADIESILPFASYRTLVTMPKGAGMTTMINGVLAPRLKNDPSGFYRPYVVSGKGPDVEKQLVDQLLNDGLITTGEAGRYKLPTLLKRAEGRANKKYERDVAVLVDDADALVGSSKGRNFLYSIGKAVRGQRRGGGVNVVLFGKQETSASVLNTMIASIGRRRDMGTADIRLGLGRKDAGRLVEHQLKQAGLNVSKRVVRQMLNNHEQRTPDLSAYAGPKMVRSYLPKDLVPACATLVNAVRNRPRGQIRTKVNIRDYNRAFGK